MTEKELMSLPSKTRPHKYTGILQTYYETGMEGTTGMIFHDDRGNSQGPHWDTKSHPNETMIYRSLGWTIWFGNRTEKYYIKIFNKKNKIVYEGPLTQDRKKMILSKYKVSFLPKELSEKRWIGYCVKEYRAELYTNVIPSVIKEKYKIEFDIGHVVHDDLDARDAIILNITFDDKGNVGYWVDSDYLDGGRHPWELSKIDFFTRKKEVKNENRKD